MTGPVVNKIAAAANSTTALVIARLSTVLVAVLVPIVGGLVFEIYHGLQDGSTASAQTAQRAVQVAVAAKTSIATVSATVAAISQRQTDAEGIQAHIADQVDKLADIETTTSIQLSAISAKLDDMSAGRERVGQLVSPPSP